MKLYLRTLPLSLSMWLVLGACTVEDPDPGPESMPAAPSATGELETVTQTVSDPNGDNWMASVGDVVQLVGVDGEPDEAAARLANEGAGITLSGANTNGWLMLGGDGVVTWLNFDGTPQRGGTLTALDGNSFGFVAYGRRFDQGAGMIEAWAVGGGDGKIEYVDDTGNTLETTRKDAIDDGAKLTAGGFDPNSSQWTIGTEDGRVLTLNTNLDRFAPPFEFNMGVPISAIVPSPSTAGQNRQIVFSGDKAAYVPGLIQVELGQGVDVSAAAASEAGKVAIATVDGRVAVIDYDALAANPTFVDIFGGKRIHVVANNGTNWVAFGEDGQAVRFDDDGAVIGAVETVGAGATIVTALWNPEMGAERWIVGTQDSFLIDITPELEPFLALEPPLSGDIYDSSPSSGGVLVVGDGGETRLLTGQGQANNPIVTVPGNTDLRAAEWGGEAFLVGGAGGKAHLIDNSGQVMGDALDLLEGRDILGIAWSGVFWLVVGEEGYAQRVRRDGTLAGSVIQLEFDTIHAARWGGDNWMVAGVKDDLGTFQLINSDGSEVRAESNLPGIPGPLFTVEWTKREWLLGGHTGLAQFVSSSGTPRGNPQDILNGRDIFSISLKGDEFLVGGDGELAVRLTNALDAPRPAVTLAGFNPIRDIVWTLPRGFSGGECLTAAECYGGAPCVEGSGDREFCCDSICDAPCEACTPQLTGLPAGQCGPIMAGMNPPGAKTCNDADPSTCGANGMCDGAGNCALFGVDVECAPAACEAGVVSAAATCSGDGMCAEPETIDCAPYAKCEGTMCATTCAMNADCVEGFVCRSGACVEPPEEEPPEEGCCAQAPGRAPGAPVGVALAVLVGLMGMRRRRLA